MWKVALPPGMALCARHASAHSCSTSTHWSGRYTWPKHAQQMSTSTDTLLAPQLLWQISHLNAALRVADAPSNRQAVIVRISLNTDDQVLPAAASRLPCLPPFCRRRGVQALRLNM